MSSVFPFIDPISALEETQTSQVTKLPLFKEYAYDFEHNCLKTINGLTYLVERNEALKIWIYKALKTVRYRHIAHSPDYGSEINTLIGSAMSSDILQSELRRFIIEALMVNPYIVELSNFSFNMSRDGIHVSFNCKTIYGDVIVPVQFEEVGI